MFALIAGVDGIKDDSLAPMARTLRGGPSELRYAFDEPASQLRRFGAAARNPNFLPEDKFDTQPLFSPRGNTFFVCQARLDNREELLQTLPGRFDSAAATPDSLLLFEAYLEWGDSCMNHVAGDYAYAAYSMSNRSLFAAVDHVGHARLYYAASRGRILMSTQLAALRTCPGISLTYNVSALGLLAEARSEPGETPFNEIKLLRGGHCLTWISGQVETRRWWQPDTGARWQFSSPGDYLERARELFGQAVKNCLRSSTPVSTTLSGGLDSGLVSATAAAQLMESGRRLTAYTSAPDPRNPAFTRAKWDFDDAPFAAQTAALHPNLRHYVLRSDSRVALDLAPKLHSLSGNPVRNGANHLWIDSIAQAAVESGSRILLTGAGGNFSISYTGLGAFSEMFWDLRWRAAFQFAAHMQGSGEKRVWKTVLEGMLPPRLFAALQSGLGGDRIPDWARLHFTSSEFRRQHSGLLAPRRPPPRTRAMFVRMARSEVVPWSADPLPQWDIEMRDPTMDRRLLEFLLTAPLAAFVQKGRFRGLAREMGSGILPESVRLRKNKGEQAADYSSAMRCQIGRYQELRRKMAESKICRHIFDLEAIGKGLQLVAMGELSTALCGNLDRALEAGLFLLDNSEASDA